MKFKFNPEYIPLLFLVLIIGLIVFGIIYSSAIKRNIFCAGPFVFLPTCDLSMLILPELNEPNGSICQSDKQCNGYKYGTKCCKGVCVKIGCRTCKKFCKLLIAEGKTMGTNVTKKYHFRPCGRRVGQSCVLDEDCAGYGAPLIFTDIPAKKTAICCGGVCRLLENIDPNTPDSNSKFLRSCKNTCTRDPNACFNYSCRI